MRPRERHQQASLSAKENVLQGVTFWSRAKATASSLTAGPPISESFPIFETKKQFPAEDVFFAGAFGHRKDPFIASKISFPPFSMRKAHSLLSSRPPILIYIFPSFLAFEPLEMRKEEDGSRKVTKQRYEKREVK